MARGLLRGRVVREAELAQQIEPEQDEDDDPEREEDLAVEDMPAVGQIRYGEELQCQR